MKKFPAIFLTASLIVSMVSCNSGKPSQSSSGSSAQSSSQAAQSSAVENTDPLAIYKPDPNKVYEIDWLGLTDRPFSPDATVVKGLEELYNVKFNMWYIESSNWDELLDLRFAAGESPDVIRTLGIAQMNKYIDNGIIMPVPQDVIATYAPDLYKELNDYDETCWINVTVNGENYGLPRVNLDGSYAYAPMWRKDWLTNVGIDKVPETLAEAEEAFRKFRFNDPNQTGKQDTYALSATGMRSIYGAFGIQIDDAQGKSVWQEDANGNLACSATTPAAKEALTLLAKWYSEGLIDPEFLSGEAHGGYWALSQDFANGKIGFTSPGAYYHINSPLYEMDAGSRNWRAIVANMASDINDASVPADDPMKETKDRIARNKYVEQFVAYGNNLKGTDGTFGNLMWGPAGDEMITFNEELSNEPDKLGKILEITNDLCTNWDTYYFTQTRYWPNEDTSHIETENGIVPNPDPAEVVKGKEYKESERNDGQQNAFKIINMPHFTKRWNVAQFKFADQPMFLEGGIENQLKIVTPTQSEIGDELEKLRETAFIAIITGEKPIEYFDEFVDRWNSIGGEKVTAEANEWWQSVKK